MNSLIFFALLITLIAALVAAYRFDFLFAKGPPTRVKKAKHDNLYEAAYNRAVTVIGDPSSGKTRWVAGQIYKKFKNFPKHAIFVFDPSGGLSKVLLDLISRDKDYENDLKRVRYVKLGDPKYILPQPEFHPDYGLTNEEQVSRVTDNMQWLVDFLAQSARFLVGVSIKEIGKELFRLLSVMRNDDGQLWQITEGKRLLVDLELLKAVLKKYGGFAPTAKWYFEKEYVPKEMMTTHERELSTRALRMALGIIEGRETRATVGYNIAPGWTAKEATEKGLLVIIDAHDMENQKEAQHYLLMQAFSQVMYWINKREVDSDEYYPVMIVCDETYSIFKIPGMAQWLGMISPLYRSRKVQLVIVLQALWQLNEEFAKQIWTIANWVCFTISNADEAELIAKQLFQYDPKYVKNPPKTAQQNPTTETVAGQDRLTADWLQHLEPRECVMKRYITEQFREKEIVWVRKTTDLPSNPPYITVAEIKERLLKKGIPVRDAIENVNARIDLAEKIKEEYKKEDKPTRRKATKS